jgi:UDP-N-acetylmuramoyl-tripeptide--D-alanyl-D-alanine ligase
MHFSAAALATQLHGRLVGDDVACSGLNTDSREIAPSQLFVALRDVRDGHEFIAEAIQQGATAYVTDGRTEPGATAIVVPDTWDALAEIGRISRSRMTGRVVGITGSVGKTTVKDLTHGVFASTYRTQATYLSYNNEIGLPLTLGNADEDVEIVVAEMGAKKPGHIAELCEIARPTVGIITRIGLAHTEFFGSLEAVASAKAELVEALPADGAAVLNGDDPFSVVIGQRSSAPILQFGLGHQCDVVATNVRLNDTAQASFHMSSPWGEAEVQLSVHGAHQVSNALAAATAALWAGVPIEAVAHSISLVVPPPWRMNVVSYDAGVVIVNDAYNANPTSMEAALRALHALPASRRIAFLGQMAELGPTAAEQHRSIAALATSLGIEVVGYQTDAYGDDAVSEVAEFLDRVRPFRAGDAILVKGSRVAGMEQVVASLDHAINSVA